MVAHGTIAFDTLTTSDQVKTGTEKSLDTSYVFNGSAKVWMHFDGRVGNAFVDSLNCSTLTDNGTGNYTTTYTNSMGNSNYAVITGVDENVSTAAGITQGDTRTTTQLKLLTRNSSATLADEASINGEVLGDLA